MLRRPRPKATTADDPAVAAHPGAKRAVQRLTQRALADALGITFERLQKHKRDRNRMSAHRLQEIACLLRVPVTTQPESDSKTDRTRAATLSAVDSAGALRLMRA